MISLLNDKKKLSKEMQGKIFFLKNKLDFIEFTFQ